MIDGQRIDPLPVRHAVQWVRLSDGAVTARATITGPFQLSGVDDDGVLLTQGPGMRARRTWGAPREAARCGPGSDRANTPLMPCPPSWEEQQLMHLAFVHGTALRALERRWPLLAPAISLAAALRATQAEVAARTPDLDRTLIEAEALLKQHGSLPEYQGPRASTQGWPTTEDVRCEEERARFYQRAVSACDLALCVIGAFVSRCRDENPDDPALKDPSIAPLLDSHRAHREEERRWVLEQLESEIRWTKAPDAVAALRARIARIQSLDERALLSDRTTLDHRSR